MRGREGESRGLAGTQIEGLAGDQSASRLVLARQVDWRGRRVSGAAVGEADSKSQLFAAEVVGVVDQEGAVGVEAGHASRTLYKQKEDIRVI